MKVLIWFCLVGPGLWLCRILLHTLVRRVLRVSPVSTQWRDRLLRRYEKLGFHPWLFAVLKTWLDPMFVELPHLLQSSPPIQTFLDLGCGFGMAGSFLLDLLPDSKAFGVETSLARVNGAAAAWGDRGVVCQGAAPDFESPALPEQLQAVFVLDVIHFLSDAQLSLTLSRIRARLNQDHYLIIRATIVPAGFGSLLWHLYGLHRRITGTKGYFRSIDQTAALITNAGFNLRHSQISGKNPEMHWFVSTPI